MASPHGELPSGVWIREINPSADPELLYAAASMITTQVLRWDEEFDNVYNDLHDLSTRTHGVFVGNELVGAAHMRPITSSGDAFLYYLAIDEAHQGEGLGTALLRHQEAFAVSVGASGLRAEIYTDINQPAGQPDLATTLVRHGYSRPDELEDPQLLRRDLP